MDLDGYQSIILVDTSKPFSTIQLPWVGNVQGRVVTIKDVGGYASLSNITIQTYMQPTYRQFATTVSYPQNTFDDGTTIYKITTNFDYVVLYPYLNTWTIIGTNVIPSVTTTVVVASNILTSSITANSIAASNIITSSITTNYIAASNITTSSMITNYLGASTIAVSSMMTNNLAASNITTSSMTTNYLGASTIAVSSMMTNNLAASNITTSSITANYLGASTIAVSSMMTNNLEASNITTSSITANYLGASTIATSSITANYIGGSIANLSTLTVSSLIQTKFISCSQGFFSSLGVNSNMPAFTLDVNGTIHATTDIILSSDLRLKENIVTIPSALEKVNSIRGVYYTLISSLTKDRKIGFIAQEIEQILPEVVHTEEEGDHMKSVSYGNVTALLIEGVKELTYTTDTFRVAQESTNIAIHTLTQQQESTMIGFQTLVDQQQSQITYIMSTMKYMY